MIWFSGGIVAAFLVDSSHAKRLATGKLSSVLVLVLLTVVIGFFQSIDSLIPLICITIAFIGITCGNTMFGLLTNATSRRFGQISYSIFVLHGLVLFGTFQFLLSSSQARSWSAAEHWTVIAAVGVVLVLLSSLSYHYIEAPFMNAAASVATKLKIYVKKMSKQLQYNRSG